jgi:hypothetical protein
MISLWCNYSKYSTAYAYAPRIPVSQLGVSGRLRAKYDSLSFDLSDTLPLRCLGVLVGSWDSEAMVWRIRPGSIRKLAIGRLC